MGRETGREKLEFENLPAKRGYFGQKPGGFRALGPGHTGFNFVVHEVRTLDLFILYFCKAETL